MTNRRATQFDGLRGQLYADTGVWVDKLDALLERLDARILADGWRVNDGVYDEGRAWSPTSSERYERSRRSSYPKEFAQFADFSEDDLGTWPRQTRHFWVGYTSRWEDEFGPVDDDNVPPYRRAPRDPMYVVAGPLADVLVTESLDEAVEHVTEQFDLVRERLRFNLELERFSPGRLYGGPENEINPDAFEHHKCPVGVSGIGSTTLERLAETFGVYSNILLYDEDDFYSCLSTAYGNRPDAEAAIENVEVAVERYRRFHEMGATRSSLLPKGLTDYPMSPPVVFGGPRSPHTEWEDDQ